ncbi:MAG: zinc-ribbon domain-containing protein, partial [Thioalkalispiraceae bacterium]
MYTQCPACNTLFRITEKQLAAARGKVRCGQCNHVYNAQGTLIDSLPSSAQPATQTSSPAKKTEAELPVKKPQPASPITETEEVPDIVSSQQPQATGEANKQDDERAAQLASKATQATKASSAFTLPQGIAEDDWQTIDLGSGNESPREEDSWFDDEHGIDEEHAEQDAIAATSFSPPRGIGEDDWQSIDLGGAGDARDDEEDSWFDDEHGIVEQHAEQDVIAATSFSPPRGVGEDDWQSIDLGGAGDAQDDEEHSWFDDEHGIEEQPAEQDVIAATSFSPPRGVGEDDWQSVDLGGAGDAQDDEEHSWIDEGHADNTVAPPGEQATEEEPDSDFMRHVSDYLDDDAAEELISEEKAADIFNEVQQQLTFPEGDGDKNENTPSRPWIGLPGDWLDDEQKPSKFSATSIPLNPDEEQELNAAILKSIEQPFTPVKQPEPPQPAKAEQQATPEFQSKESIVLESSKHLIGQHDMPAPPVIDDVVPLRLRNSVNVEPAVPRSGLKWFLLLSSTLVLVALLLAQVVLFRSTELANMFPQWQPLLIKACENLPCRDSGPQD